MVTATTTARRAGMALWTATLAAGLAMPLVLFASGHRQAAFENRALAPLPSRWLGAWDRPASAGEAVDAWVRDHLPFRRSLTLAYNAARFHALGESPAREVVVGRDGWLFLRKALVEGPLHAGGDPAKTARSFDRLIAAARAARMPLAIALSPNKASIYPDQLSARWRERREEQVLPWQRALEQWADRRAEVPNLWARWRSLREREPASTGDAWMDSRLRTLYRPRDRHWHWETGRLQADAILETLGLDTTPVALPEPGAYSLRNSELAERFLLFHLPEPYAPLAPRAGVEHRAQPVPGSGHAIETFVNPHASFDRSVLLIHDSFLEKSVPFLTAMFGRAVLVHHALWASHPDRIEPLVGEADALVVQMVEDFRGLWTPRMPRLARVVRESGAGRE